MQAEGPRALVPFVSLFPVDVMLTATLVSVIVTVAGKLKLVGETRLSRVRKNQPHRKERARPLGEHDETAKLYPAALELINAGAIVMYEIGSMQRCAAIAAASGRQWQKAEEHYETALRVAQELPLKIEQPETRRWFARMLLDRDAPGDRDKARQLLTEAIEMYRRIGTPSTSRWHRHCCARCSGMGHYAPAIALQANIPKYFRFKYK